MVKKKTLQEFIMISKEKHGEDAYDYKDAIYINNRTRLKLWCNTCNKAFMSRPTDHTTKLYGCPECRKSKSERAAIAIFEELLKCAFLSATPKIVPWLGGLYLDGYNEEKKLAIEYQGIQHYIYPNYYHKTIEDFDRQVINDCIKQEMCIVNGVKLIHIPYKYTFRNKEKMKKYIKKLLKNLV